VQAMDHLKMRSHAQSSASSSDSSSSSSAAAKCTQLRTSAGGCDGAEPRSPGSPSRAVWPGPDPPQQWRYLNWLKLFLGLIVVTLVVSSFSFFDASKLEDVYK
jgi:hypothetical protein